MFKTQVEPRAAFCGRATSMLSQFLTRHASSSPVMFVTLKRFAVLVFLPSCSVKSLLCRDLEVGKDSVR